MYGKLFLSMQVEYLSCKKKLLVDVLVRSLGIMIDIILLLTDVYEMMLNLICPPICKTVIQVSVQLILRLQRRLILLLWLVTMVCPRTCI